MIVLATLVFDHGSYSQYSTHSTLEECQIAKHGLDAVCVGDSPSHLYINDEAEVVPEFQQLMGVTQ